MLQNLFSDVRYAVRTFRKSPGFTFVALLTLALGIGANSAIFSVVNGVLLRPLPYQDPGRLVMLWQQRADIPANTVTGEDFADWRKLSRSYEGMAALSGDLFTLTGVDRPRSYEGVPVSPEFFSILGVQPALGRAFLPEEEHTGRDHEVIFSDRMWKQAFGSASGITGKKIVLNHEPYTVIGVMPAGFAFLGSDTDLWVPLAIETMNDRQAHLFSVVARLRPRATIGQARAELKGIAAQLAKEYPVTNHGWSADVVTLRDQIVGGVRTAILVLLGAVGLVLLIACANTANLLLVRAAGRRREIGIRTALGASAGRLARQVLTESVLLAFVGGALGILIAWAAIHMLRTIYPGNLPRVEGVRLNAAVLWFTLGISCIAGIVFGMIPALASGRTEINESLREGSKGVAGGVRSRRTRNLLVGMEVALSVLLLIGAGLLLRSLLALTGSDLGFRPDHLLTMTVRAAEQEYSNEQQEAGDFARVVERLRSLPGVVSAAAATNAPALSWNQGRKFGIQEKPWPPGVVEGASYASVSPDYFRTTGIRLLRGSAFTPADRHGSLEVAIISEAFAKHYFPNQDPLGQHLVFYTRAFGANSFGPAIPREIVGIVSNIRNLQQLDSDASLAMYAPQLQNTLPFTFFFVRTSGNPIAMAGAARHAVNRVLPNVAVANMLPMETRLETAVARPRFNASLLGVFAALALVLAVVGIYGVAAYSVQQRRDEIGIRMAIGARSSDILQLILWQGMAPAVIGAAAGLLAAIPATRVIARLLYGIPKNDPLTFIFVPLVLIVSAALAALVPALQASRVDPISVLRSV